MIGRLRTLDSLTIERPATDEGYFEGNEYVPAPTTSVPIIGNLQPFTKNPNVLKILPDGLKATDIKLLHTKNEILTVNQFSKAEADQLIIDGATYIATEIMDFSKHTSLELWHYKVVFVRRDKVAD